MGVGSSRTLCTQLWYVPIIYNIILLCYQSIRKLHLYKRNQHDFFCLFPVCSYRISSNITHGCEKYFNYAVGLCKDISQPVVFDMRTYLGLRLKVILYYVITDILFLNHSQTRFKIVA